MAIHLDADEVLITSPDGSESAAVKFSSVAAWLAKGWTLTAGGLGSPGTGQVYTPFTASDGSAVLGVATANATYAKYVEGLLAARPTPAAAAPLGQNVLYFATDDNGGTIYKTNGTTWIPLTAGISTASKGTITTGKNITGTVTHSGSVTTTFVDIPGTNISLNATTADVWLCYQAVLTQTAGGTGAGYTALIETTGAGYTVLQSANIPLPGNGLSQIIPYTEYPLGPVASTRTFRIATLFITATGSPQHDIVNGATSPTFLRAEGR